MIIKRWIQACLCLLALSPLVATDLELEPFLSGLGSPLYLTHAGDGSGRLFIVDRGGRILIHDGQQLLGTAFLDISGLVDTSGEGGLLGLAFHPDYESNGRFFINYTRSSTGTFQTVIAEYGVNAGDPNLADSAQQILLTYDQPRMNHNGGWIGFGPDGYLYIASGDGGGAGDPFDNGQDITTILGAMLRIDIDSGSPYGIPPGNPFVGESGADEIYAYGLRNPWRASFDRMTGRFFVGDVGQNSFEEIDILTLGGNYGWNITEGNSCHSPGTNCDMTGLIPPIFDYDRNDGRSVTGGYIYRGPETTIHRGDYIFGDFGVGSLWSLREVSPGNWQRTFHASVPLLVSFGEDEEGNLYVLSLGGSIMRIRFGSADPEADLSLVKIAQQSSPPVGTTLNYALTVTNLGPDSAESVSVTDTLPDSLMAQGVGTASGSCTRNGNQVTCALGLLAASANATINITAKVLESGSIENTATVDSTTPDPNSANNSSSITVQAQPVSADLALSKTVDSSNPLAGSVVTFTIELVNQGPDEASDVTLSDPLPAGFELQSVTSDLLECQFGDGSVTCTADSLEASAAAQAQISGRVINAGPLTNQAAVTFDGDDPNMENNSAEATLTVLSPSDLVLTKRLQSGLFPGKKAAYLIRVQNQGDVASQAPITVTDPLPAPLSFFSVVAPGWICDASESNEVTCRHESPLEAGEESRIEIRGLVGSSAGEVENTATLTVADDADESNNVASATENLLTIEELPLTFSQLALGGGFELVLLVSNRSGASWQGVADLREDYDLPWSTPWSLDEEEQADTSQFDILLQPHASQKFVLGGDETARAGFLRITPDTDSSALDLAISFFYQLSSEGLLNDSTGTPSDLPGRIFEFPVEQAGTTTNTGFAWAPLEGGDTFLVEIHLYDDLGTPVETVTINFEGHADYLLEELFTELPETFRGLMRIESPRLIHLTVLRLDSGGTLQLTSVQPRIHPH